MVGFWVGAAGAAGGEGEGVVVVVSGAWWEESGELRVVRGEGWVGSEGGGHYDP